MNTTATLPCRHRAVVTAVSTLTPRTRRITLSGPTLVGLFIHGAQAIELILDCGSSRRVTRCFISRHSRPDIGEIDLDIFMHKGGGPGSDWVRSARPGTVAEFVGPRESLKPRPAAWHLFVGDEASLPAIATMTSLLGPNQITLVLVEVSDSTDEVPLTATQVKWIHRGGTPSGTPPLLAEALQYVYGPDGAGKAYLIGERRTMNTLRDHLSQHDITPDDAFVEGYWDRSL
jgi:NADPH-dependent ferric siderophore reductase